MTTQCLGLKKKKKFTLFYDNCKWLPSSAGVENKMLLLVLPRNKRQLYIKAQSLDLAPTVSKIFKSLNSNPLRKVRGFEVSTQRTFSENVGNISATDLGFPTMFGGWVLFRETWWRRGKVVYKYVSWSDQTPPDFVTIMK